MRFLLIPAATAMAVGLALTPVHAQAKGCAKGAAVGAVGGHMAGHHGVLGAGAGCAIGHHHEASKHAAQNQAQDDTSKHTDTSH